MDISKYVLCGSEHAKKRLALTYSRAHVTEKATLNLIELTGAPCAGKSYLAKQIEGQVGLVMCDQVWINSEIGINKLPSTLRMLFREIYLLCSGSLCLGIRRNTKLVATLFKTDWSFRRRLNIWRNVLHKYAVHRLVSRQDKEGMIVYDEGISHLPFLFAASRTKCPEDIREYYPFGLPMIIRVTADGDDIVERLKLRGHKMINHEAEILPFVRANDEAYILQTKDLELFPKELIIQDKTNAEDIMRDVQKWILV